MQVQCQGVFGAFYVEYVVGDFGGYVGWNGDWNFIDVVYQNIFVSILLLMFWVCVLVFESMLWGVDMMVMLRLLWIMGSFLLFEQMWWFGFEMWVMCLIVGLFLKYLSLMCSCGWVLVVFLLQLWMQFLCCRILSMCECRFEVGERMEFFFVCWLLWMWVSILFRGLVSVIVFFYQFDFVMFGIMFLLVRLCSLMW